MRTRVRGFPGTDRETDDRLALDVARDEAAFVNAMIELRRQNAMSLEAIGFLLGTDPSRISRYLKGHSSVTITNYLRLARALGYRCRIVFEAADDARSGNSALKDLKLAPHKVVTARRSPGS